MATHTPGPWQVSRNACGELAPFDMDEGRSLLSCEVENPLPLAEREANAALIAAAPELLEALTALVNWGWEHTSPCDDDSPNDLLVKACEVIVKAGGEL